MMHVNPYESPRPTSHDDGARSLKDRRWSLVLSGFFAGGYVGAWVGSLSGAAVGVMFAVVTGAGMTGNPDPAFAFIETLITTGLLLAIVGTLTGCGLGASLGVALGVLVAISRAGVRAGFVGMSCILASAAAVVTAAAMFGVDVSGPTPAFVAVNQHHLVVQVAILGVVGFGGLFGGGLLGRVLREVAWESGLSADVAVDAQEPRMSEREPNNEAQ